MKIKKGYSDHHLVYGKDRADRNQELTLPIHTKEHYVITLLQRYKYVSYGFFLSVLWELFRLLVIKIYNKLLKDVKNECKK